MPIAPDVANAPAARDGGAAMAVTFPFVPDTLRAQCRALVTTYHAMHGYACLPDLLWKAGLAGFIDQHRNLRAAMRSAARSRSARRTDELLTAVATEILAIELLAREYGAWSEERPATRAIALELIEQGAPGPRIWLMAHYLHPPRLDSPAMVLRLPRGGAPGSPGRPHLHAEHP